MKVLIKAEVIEKSMQNMGLTKKELCKRCEFSQYVLKKIMSGDPNCQIRHVYKLAKVLNLKLVDFVCCD